MNELSFSKKTLRSDHKSKWTAEFLVAAELSRRGFTVAFTHGSHTPLYDLLAVSPAGNTVKIDVKGQAGKGSWLIKSKSLEKDLFYVLVYAPVGASPRESDRFFVLTQSETNDLLSDYKKRHSDTIKSDRSYFGWQDAVRFEDTWDKLTHQQTARTAKKRA